MSLLSVPYRITIVEGSNGLALYFYPTFKLSDSGRIAESGWGKEQKYADDNLGGTGARLFMDLQQQLPMISYTISMYQLTIKRQKGFLWQEIEPMVIEMLHGYYGDFTIVRESWLTRLCAAFRRTVLEPLGLVKA